VTVVDDDAADIYIYIYVYIFVCVCVCARVYSVRRYLVQILARYVLS
jgi:hypothetical protein